jgi:hypothetical protein
MMKALPRGDQAILDIRKIEGYCPNSSHPRGRHKARVFREALDLQRSDASWLRDALLEAARSREASPIAVNPLEDTVAHRCGHPATRKECCGKNDLDRRTGESVVQPPLCARRRHWLELIQSSSMAAARRNPTSWVPLMSVAAREGLRLRIFDQ